MTAPLRLAVTADLHWGVRAAGDEATRLLLADLYDKPPDVVILAGDIGAGDDFERCLQLFADLPSKKALVPGNHDVWVKIDDARGDSLQVYRSYLPDLCRRYGFTYLDQEPLLLPEAGLALVGSMNWYDYSWSIDRLPEAFPDWQERLQTKRFTRGRHNDANYVRWPLDDVGFTREAVAALAGQLAGVIDHGQQAIVVAHHPPFYGLNFPRPDGPLSPDALLWDAFGGNRDMEALLARHAAHIPFAFCGHTHRARANTLGSIRGYNIGGDYHYKRMLLLDWPAGTVEERVYGEPAT